MEETRSGARETAMKILYQISILEKAEASYDLNEIFSKVEGRNKKFIENKIYSFILMPIN